MSIKQSTMLSSESRQRRESATLPPPLPLMFAVAPATATVVYTIASEDGRMLVGSASANAKVMNGLHLENSPRFAIDKKSELLTIASYLYVV